MNNKDLKYVVDFYNNVIMQQIIKPLECEKAYRLVKGEAAPAVPYYQKMRAISVYVQGLQQQVLDGLEQMFEDFDDEQEELASHDDPRSKDYIPKDSAASPSVPDNTQSHTEEVNDVDMQIADLEAKYEKAEDANEKRSITMKIKALKNKGLS